MRDSRRFLDIGMFFHGNFISASRDKLKTSNSIRLPNGGHRSVVPLGQQGQCVAEAGDVQDCPSTSS